MKANHNKEQLFRYGIDSCAKIQFESESQHRTMKTYQELSCAKIQFESESQHRKRYERFDEGCAKIQFESESQRVNNVLSV